MSEIEDGKFRIDRRSALITSADSFGSTIAKSTAVAAPETNGAGDFDFLFGTWSVHHRWFREGRIVEFDGDSTTRPIAGGIGNLEEATIRSPKGTYHGAALRLYRPNMERWSIWWIDSRDPDIGSPPVIGSFVDGIGTFVATDLQTHALTRFVWKNITTTSAHWEQAFSTDDGQHWNVDWNMEFRRVS